MTPITVRCSLVALVVACAPTRPASCPTSSPEVPLEEIPRFEPKARDTSFQDPEPLPLDGYVVLGPFDSPGNAGSALEEDYLTKLGGEAEAHLTMDTRVSIAGKEIAARSATPDTTAIVDLVKLYEKDTDQKVAYAAGVVTVENSTHAFARFGSDDGATVWINGRRVHHIVAGRPIHPDDDRFEVNLEPGPNRILIKVENGFGGWGFALRLYDESAAAQIETNTLRRHLERLELGPSDDEYTLKHAFPLLTWARPEEAAKVMVEDSLRVRWFAPDLTECTAPGPLGRYVALAEAKTLDGFTHRRMLTFAKVAADPVPWLPDPPHARAPTIHLPWPLDLDEAQQTELSQYFWSGAHETLTHGQPAAIARLALVELGEQPPPADEPAWLSSGFIRNAEHQLALRSRLEGRAARPLAPPQRLARPARSLRRGTEIAAGVKPGTAAKLRTVAREWAHDDPNGFVVLVARRGVVFMHEGFNGFEASTQFWPASIGKTIAAFTFAQAVDQGLVAFDDPVGSVLPEWTTPTTAHVTFRHCFYHTTGLTGHMSHDGLFNPYLDGALLVQDATFTTPGSKHIYNGDDVNLAGKALEALTGKSIFRLLYEQMQKPFDEDVTQFDLGVGDRFSALYVAKVGQMVLGGGQYGDYQLLRPETLELMFPQRTVDFAPGIGDAKLYTGIGLLYMPDPSGARAHGVLGPNVVGHGSASGSVFRIDRDHELVVVIGRNEFKDYNHNDAWAAKFMTALAQGLSG